MGSKDAMFARRKRQSISMDALPKRCRNVADYIGRYKPRCHGGIGCQACWSIYLEKHPGEAPYMLEPLMSLQEEKPVQRVTPVAKTSNGHASNGNGHGHPFKEVDERIRLLTRENDALKRRLSQTVAKTDIIVRQVADSLRDKTIVVDIPPAPEGIHSGKREETAVFCVGDIHMGHYFPSGPYAYNVNIATERMQMAVDKFIATTRDRRTSATITDVHLYVIGDMVEGENMRPGHGHSIEAPVFEQAVFHAPRALASTIMKLLGDFQRVKVVAVPGNHGRNGPAKGDAHAHTNWDSVCYETTRHIVTSAMAQQQSDRRDDLVWDLPSDRVMSGTGDQWFSVDYVYDWCNCIIHGEDMGGKSWGGIPFYGVEKIISRYANIVSDPIDFMFMGHIHVDAEIPTNYRKVYVNGAVESSSTFVRKQLVSSSPPSQMALFYDAEHGPLSKHTLWLDERRPQGSRVVGALQEEKVLQLA